MQLNHKILVIFSLILFPFAGFGQGCSDAGFCTMGAMKPAQDFNKKVPVKLRSIGLTLYEGKSNTSAVIRAGIFDFGLLIAGEYDLQVKVPYMRIDGNFASTSGIGDISLSLTKNLHSTPTYSVMGTIGAKIPTNRSDLRPNNRQAVLPMYYQTSLGTYDFIAGVTYINKEWMISAGYQQPLIHINENTFEPIEAKWSWYEGGMDYVRQHDGSRMLKRGADVMMRFERNFRMSRVNFSLGLLPIYRITKDQVLNDNDEYVKLEGTTGLALSGLAGVSYKFNVFSSIQFIYGKRITDRSVNPDGLTRKHVINLSYNYNF